MKVITIDYDLDDITKFENGDLVTFCLDIHNLTGIYYADVKY